MGVVKRLLVVLGVLALLGGLVLVAIGVLVATAVRPDGTVTSAPAHLRSSGVAVVAGDLSVDAGFLPLPTSVGTVSLGITARDGRPLFAGAAVPSAVTRYLAGAPYDVITALTAGADATTVAVPGTRLPRPPATSSIWRVKASGRTVSFTSLPSGALVVMHDDASQGVDANLVVTLHAPRLRTYAWVGVGVGVVLVLLALLLLVRARRRSPAPRLEGSAVLPPAVLPPVVPAPDADAHDDVAPLAMAPSDTGVTQPSDVDAPTVVAAPVEVAPASRPQEEASGVESTAEEDAPAEAVGAPEPDPVYDALVAAYGGDPARGATVAAPPVAPDGEVGQAGGG